MNYHSLTNEIQLIQALEQDMQVLNCQPSAIHSIQAIKTPPITNESYTVYIKNDIPPNLLISIERKEKKDESTN